MRLADVCGHYQRQEKALRKDIRVKDRNSAFHLLSTCTNALTYAVEIQDTFFFTETRKNKNVLEGKNPKKSKKVNPGNILLLTVFRFCRLVLLISVQAHLYWIGRDMYDKKKSSRRLKCYLSKCVSKSKKKNI